MALSELQRLGPYLTPAEASGTYLPLAGGTLTGDLVLPADPTTAMEAATKQYVDANAGGGISQKFVNGDAGGDKTTTTSWSDVGTWASLSLAAAAGDVLELGYRYHYTTGNVNNGLHLTFSIAGSDVDPGSGGFGLARQFVGALSRYVDILVHHYTVQAGDISAGSVAVKVRCKHETGAYTLFNNSTDPLPQFWMKNLGPVAS